MEYMTKMEMLDTFCILCLDGLKRDNGSAALKTFGPTSGFRALRCGADSLAELGVDGENLGVAHKGKGKDGNGVRGLPGGHGKGKSGKTAGGNCEKMQPDKQSRCSAQPPTCELMVNKCVAQWESSSSWPCALDAFRPRRLAVLLTANSSKGQAIWNFL